MSETRTSESPAGEDDGPLDIDALVAAAHAAQKRAYAPYSNYPVGCALFAEGAVYSGANIENASYGLCLCAERTALAHAVMAGVRTIRAVAVASQSVPPASPCGMCLQSLIEFCTDLEAVAVILVNSTGQRREFLMSDLLPHAFTKHELDNTNT